MNNFTSDVKAKALKLIQRHNMLAGTKNVIVGFSGGADSVCLLHLLKSLSNDFGFDVVALHVNHGIRGDEAERDEKFAVDFCKSNNIRCFVERFNCVEMARQAGESLEECGRRVRYSFFNEQCCSDDKIATAHNANDNAETVVFNLSRGTSLKGACGIPVVRGNVIRPLLLCTREEIEGYCHENGLSYITDSTNLSDDYTRNKIRHRVLPVLKEINSSSIANVSAFCENTSDIYSYINSQACKVLEEAFLDKDTYKLSLLEGLHIALLRECIVTSYKAFSGKSLDSRKINEIAALVNSKGRLQLYGDEFVEVIKNKFRYYKANSSLIPPECRIDSFCNLDFGVFTVTFSKFTESLKNQNKKILANLIDCDKIVGNLYLRARRGGDRITLPDRNGSKSLKKLFNEMAVPVELRNYIPVLCDDNGVVWVYGAGSSANYIPTDASTNIMVVKGENNG